MREFVDALRPGSPFLMASVEGFTGYNVHGRWFPSVKVTPRSLDALLAELPVTGTSVLRTDNSIRRLRPGMTRCRSLPDSLQWGYDETKAHESTNRAPAPAPTPRPLWHYGTEVFAVTTQIPALDALTCISIADVDANVLRNADAPWNMFSSQDYWRRNYSKLQAEDREIIRRVSHFLVSALAGCPPVQRAIDVGAGTNLYPALLLLPWTEQILLADFSKSNVRWLRDQLADDASPWPWCSFWQEMREAKGYSDITRPRERLREVCVSEPGHAGIEQLSVFDLPKAWWNLGTMFFVAESITEDPAEFRAAVAAFASALTPGAPFAAAFMAGSDAYPVDSTHFPDLPVKPDDVRRHLTELGVREPNVDLLDTSYRVRDGYARMVVATGFASNQ